MFFHTVTCVFIVLGNFLLSTRFRYSSCSEHFWPHHRNYVSFGECIREFIIVLALKALMKSIHLLIQMNNKAVKYTSLPGTLFKRLP